MNALLALIGNDAFISFLSTFGLAALLVLFFVFVRDPKRERILREQFTKEAEVWREEAERRDTVWQQKYDRLIENYTQLADNYNLLQQNLEPEKRQITTEQARHLCYMGIDRDLYKLYYYMREKAAGRTPDDVSFFVRDSIQKTNSTWASFTSPFPLVRKLGDLYGMYSNGGQDLIGELEGLLTKDGAEFQDIESDTWRMLRNNAIAMKQEFDGFVSRHKENRPVVSYAESAASVG